VHIGNQLFRQGGADSPPTRLTAAQLDELRAKIAEVRKDRPARRDSIFNGADDDGSGSMGLLEVAEWFATRTGDARPKRSVLFVWHAAEEVGLWGSEWFTDHPTVPREQIVSNINLDMIGRGAAGDAPKGGPQYLEILGSRRLSTEYGDLVEAVNKEQPQPFALNYEYDAPGHPQQYYCRSDHWNYARYGIPTVFFSSGGHADYHMVSDEPQYIDYPRYARVTRFVKDVAQAVANRAQRPAVDKQVPGPNAQCVQ
jgi:Zn-dependent M28 family amino/carboxypeptidase